MRFEMEVIDDEYEIVMDKIKSILFDFDSMSYIKNKIDIILKAIEKDIKKIIYVDDKLYIYLYNTHCYAMNYDFKNYPLFSCYFECLTIDYSDTIIQFDDNSIIDLDLIDLKTYDKVV